MVLSSLGVPLKELKDIKENRSPESIITLIEKQEQLLDQKMRKLMNNYALIHTRLKLINYGLKVKDGFKVIDGQRVDTDNPDGTNFDETMVTVLYRDEFAFIAGPRNHFVPGESFYQPFVNFCNHANELRMNLDFPIGGFQDSFEAFLKAPGEPDYFFSLDPEGNQKMPAGEYLVAFHRGYYGDFGDLPERMTNYAKDHGLTLTGRVYAIYLHDEICINQPDQFLVQVCVAVTKP